MKNNFVSRILAVIAAVVSTVFLGCLNDYLFLPAWNIRSSGLWWFLIIHFIIFSGFSVLFNEIRKARGNDEWSDTRNITAWIPAGVVVGLLIVFFCVSISGWEMFHASQYANLVSISNGDFNEDIIELKGSSEVVIVDQKTAQKLGDRTLGSIKNASWFEADNEYNLIKISDQEYRISPIYYGDIFKYGKAKSEGLPGYILVNAKTEEARFVELEEGMKYSPSAFWSYDLARHLRNQYPDAIFGKSFFEINDEYYPFWITTIQEPKIGAFGALTTKTVVITDAISGDSKEYLREDLPEWVDHVDSVDYLMERIEDHYRYENGWWNPSLTGVLYTSYHYKDKDEKKEENEFTPFDGYNSLIGKDGSVLFYTGLTPANGAETNIGFLLINPRKGEVRRYNITGAEESSAQSAAEGLVQNLKYSASFPTIVNIDGVETYFMLLKDNAGLIQRYALCNVNQYSKVVQSESLDEVIKNYRIKIGKNDESQTTEDVKLTGVVDNVATAIVNGETQYYFSVKGQKILFISSIKNNSMQPLKLVVGANVTITYYLADEKDVGIVTKIQFK